MSTPESDPRHSVDRMVMRWNWHCRRAGGLFVGMRLEFPVSVLFPSDKVRHVWSLSLGLLVATLHLEFRTRNRELPSRGAKATPTATAGAGATQHNAPAH